jgi:hypothetical protein
MYVGSLLAARIFAFSSIRKCSGAGSTAGWAAVIIPKLPGCRPPLRQHLPRQGLDNVELLARKRNVHGLRVDQEA